MNPRTVVFQVRRFRRSLTAITIGVLLAAVTCLPSMKTSASARSQRTALPSQTDRQPISESAAQQIRALLDEKESRSPAQQKLDSQILYAIKSSRGEQIATGVPRLQLNGLTLKSSGEIEVDITADIQGDLIENLYARRTEIVSVFPRYRSIRAIVPLDQLEGIAALPQVKFIQPRQEAIVRRAPADQESPAVGNKISEGDATHKAAMSRNMFGFNGAGVRIGVLSDGVENLATSIASGDLPSNVVVLPGQEGLGDEGTAMLEIVHDLAPGAQLYFATAIGGVANFAANIHALRAVGCDIIVDDIGYISETPFQDGQNAGISSPTNGALVTQAINDVTAAGALYFASAGNGGNKDDDTSGTWEGDFVDGGPMAPLPFGSVHDFGSGTRFDTITASGQVAILFWSDPLGSSSNDYDLFVLNSNGTTVLASSTNIQNGSQDPFEAVGRVTVNNRLVILKKAGAANRFLHLGTLGGRLAINTEGEVTGHPAAANAFACAATPAGSGIGPPPNPFGPFPGPFLPGNVVEQFSSDGPRRIFFNADGSPVTPGNFSSSGGLLRQKPDVTAADGVSISGAGDFPTPFFGTSAAAPHAAAIAALLKSAKPTLTAEQVRSALTSTAIDIEAPGVDRDSGAGILSALEALESIGAVPSPNFEVGTIVVSEMAGNDDNVIEPGETAVVSVELRNTGVANASNVTLPLMVLSLPSFRRLRFPRAEVPRSR